MHKVRIIFSEKKDDLFPTPFFLKLSSFYHTVKDNGILNTEKYFIATHTHTINELSKI